MSESSHPPTWPGKCSAWKNSHPHRAAPRSRSQADPNFWIVLGRKQYITALGRKPAELSHMTARGRKPTPKKTQEGASPQAHAGARRRPQAEGVWGREGGRLKSSCTQREGGEGRDSHPLYTPNTYIFITDIKKRCF